MPARRAGVGAKLIQAPLSSPGTDTCVGAPAGVLAACAACWCHASIKRGIERASVATSAKASAVRSRAKGACRRRGRAGAWRVAAIGPRSLAVPPSGGGGSADAAVLRQRSLLPSGGVDTLKLLSFTQLISVTLPPLEHTRRFIIL